MRPRHRVPLLRPPSSARAPARLSLRRRGCWDAEGCQEGSEIYTQEISPNSHPERRSGILDVEHPENPFGGHTIVAVPVCTGDVHLGGRYAVYRLKTDDGRLRDFMVRHRGQTNVRAVLRWIHANAEGPREIFVAGSSAGGVAVSFYANLLARHYVQARVTALGERQQFDPQHNLVVVGCFLVASLRLAKHGETLVAVDHFRVLPNQPAAELLGPSVELTRFRGLSLR